MNKWINQIVGKDQSMISYASPQDKLPKRILINSVEMATGRRRVEQAYDRLKAMNIPDVTVWQHLFPLLQVDLSYDRNKLNNIPSHGPLVLIANHPFGVLDGLALGYLLSHIRSDFRLIVNEVLCREPLLGPYLLPIDFREDKSAFQTNINTRNTAIQTIKDGGSIGIFPSGGVATAPKPFSRQAEDLEWKNFLVKIIKRHDARIVPIYFHGQNSQLFQIASHINQNLRLGLLLNEVNNKRGKTLKINIGDPIHSIDYREMKGNEILDRLRKITFSLAQTT